MKQKRLLLFVLVGLVVVLGAGLALVTHLAAEPEETEDDPSIALTDYAAADITAIQYTRGDETVNLERVTETVETTDEETGEVTTEEESRWILTDRPDETVEQTLINSMTTALGTLTATRDLGENESLAQFGLDEPVLTVCATANGEEHIYYYGDTNEVTGEVYLMVEGETSLYTVSYTSLNVFQYTADELIQVITAEVEPEETSE